ncbi:MAG: TonB-dependent receptor, partial [Flavobacteriaceae bacterium]|nr:TonB-dependent receptor [Flavobacteriaceae bacterium]
MAVSAIVFLLAQTAIAENLEVGSTNSNEVEQKKTVVVTANRYPTDIREVGSSVSIIDAEEIKQSGQPTVLEVLRSVPGVDVVQSGGRGRTTSVFIRGAESDQTLLMIDGVRANDNTTGLFDFADIKAENIDRIEVIRGPQSVLYGSEAIGGVIQIFTKNAGKGTTANAFVEAGSRGTHQYRANIGHRDKNISSSNTVSFFGNDGISAAQSKNANPEDDSYRNVTLSSKNTAKFLEDGSINFIARYSNSESELDAFDFMGNVVDDLNFEQDTELLTLSTRIEKSVNDWVTPSILIGYTKQEIEGIDPDSEFNNFDISNDTFAVTTKVDITPTWGGTTSLGHVFETRKADNRGNFDA